VIILPLEIPQENYMSKKILVVDDEPDFVRIILAKLKSNGYEVISAINGGEAIKEAQLQKPDLIVMDITMPDMDGTDAVRLLQYDVRTENIPIIFISGSMVNLPENEDTRQATINGKLFTALAKPFKAEKLLSEINKLMKA
jgi:two-component system, OmpR family, alkaline phosphatase synthesis response regulator PhoP